MRLYECKYEYKGELRTVESRRGLLEFSEGFWLNRDYKLAVETCTECWLWIPPSRIHHIVVNEVSNEKEL